MASEQFDAVLAEARSRHELFGSELTSFLGRLAAAHAAEVEARLNGEKSAHEQTKRALAEATETWTDDAGNAWRPPTAWAYAQSCRVRDEMRQRAEAAERNARRLDALEIDVAENGPLVLHNGEGVGGSNYRGLGMANTGRTLRAAIDACIGGGEGK